MPEMRDQIQSLIANNQTEDALKLLAQNNSDALLLQAQLNSGKKNFNLGLIDFSEWQRIQARVNYGALDMAGRTPVVVLGNGSSTANTGASVASSAPDSSKPKIFISYNHRDQPEMKAVMKKLQDAGMEVFVDIQNMGVGENIEVFIEKALKENQCIISIISENSLRSGWVNKELSTALLLNRFGSKWLPVLLDKSCFDGNFYNNTLDEFDKKMEELRETIIQTAAKKRDIRPFQDELSRTQDLQNDFGKTIQALRNHLAEDISGDNFESGMNRVIRTINS